MNLKFRFIALAFSALIGGADLTGQNVEDRVARAATRAEHIANLSDSLRIQPSEKSRTRYESVKEQATTDLFTHVDAYISDSFNAGTASPESIKNGLDRLLVARRTDSYNDGAFAKFVDLRAGRFLLSTVELWRGGGAINESAFRLSAYSAVQEVFTRQASTGSEMDGFGVLTNTLPSPVPGESWIICHGALYGYNGTKVRVRIYAFDGTSFRTIFQPEDFLASGFDESFELTTAGFKLHSVRKTDGNLYTDEYTLPASGPLRIAQTIEH
jgi:hypothetical protein